MLKVGHVTEVEEVMSFFSSFSFAKALEIAPWSRDKQGKRHFLPFHRNYSAKLLRWNGSILGMNVIWEMVAAATPAVT